MKAKLLIVTVIMIGLGIAACKKDKYTTKPQLTFKSMSASALNQGEVISFKIEVTDKEGDIQDSMWVQKVSTCLNGNNITKYKVADFPSQSNLKAEIDMTYIYGPNGAYAGINNGCPQSSGSDPAINDSSYFRLWIRDLDGNISDTINTPKFVLIGKK